MYLTDKYQKSESFKLINIATQHSKIDSGKTDGRIGGEAIFLPVNFVHDKLTRI